MKQTPPTPPPKPSLTLNWEDWLPYLEDSTASDEDKRKLIEALWTIMIAFVDLGWDVARQETCGETVDLTAALRAAVVTSIKEDAA